MVLPTLVHSKKTRTSNEVLVYYNLDVGLKTKILHHNGAGVNEHTVESCGGDDACPGGSFTATFLEVENQGAVGTIPAKAPLLTAAEGEQQPGTAGDSATVVCLPDPTNDVLICFDQGAAPSPGLSVRPVPRKFNPVDHYVRQRSENSISLTDLHVSHWNGLQRIKGRRCTIIIKVSPDGTGVFSEIQYYCNVLLNPVPMNSGSDGNANIEISMDGSFSFACVFAAVAP